MLVSCQQNEDAVNPLVPSVVIDSITSGVVYGQVWKSVEAIDFSVKEKEEKDSLIGEWTNPDPVPGSKDPAGFTFTLPPGLERRRGIYLVADNGTDQDQKELMAPQIWVSSLYINHIVTENAFNYIWPEASRKVSGIKPWDGKISYVSLNELKAWEKSLRKRNMRISYEKGRWPLPPDMYELQVQKEINAMRDNGDERGMEILRAEAEADIIADRGEMLSTDDYQALYLERNEFIRKAAAPELVRLRKIQEAGMLDLFETIEFDGAIIKNVFPYTTGITQWNLPLPEEDRFKPGFGSPEEFLELLAEMAVYIRNQLGEEGQHIQFRILCNFHFWTYGEPVIPEQLPDGTWKYHNVSFHRFREHTLDFKDVVEYIKDRRDIFAGVTTDYPYELYRQAASKARYGRMAADLEQYGISLRPIVTAMSASDGSMQDYHGDIVAFFTMLEKEVRPEMYMIQSWGTHPTRNEVKQGEYKFGSWLNAIKIIVGKF